MRPPVLGQIKGGSVRALAVTSTKEASVLPGVPPLADTLPGFEAVLYYGIGAPAGTPRPIIERLNKELRAIVTSEEVSKRIIADGGDPVASTPEEYAANLARGEAKWAALVKKIGLVIN